MKGLKCCTFQIITQSKMKSRHLEESDNLPWNHTKSWPMNYVWWLDSFQLNKIQNWKEHIYCMQHSAITMILKTPTIILNCQSTSTNIQIHPSISTTNLLLLLIDISINLLPQLNLHFKDILLLHWPLKNIIILNLHHWQQWDQMEDSTLTIQTTQSSSASTPLALKDVSNVTALSHSDHINVKRRWVQMSWKNYLMNYGLTNQIPKRDPQHLWMLSVTIPLITMVCPCTINFHHFFPIPKRDQQLPPGPLIIHLHG